jgi:spore coat protein U-like protein
MVRYFTKAAFFVASTFASAAFSASCTVSAPTLNFSSYDPLSFTANDSSTNIVVTCSRTVTTGTENVSYSLSLSAGTGTFSARTMLRGATPLIYNLYTTALRDAASVWGDGTGGSITLSASLRPLNASFSTRTANHALYGRIAPRQDVPVGAYAASVVLTINY